MFGIKELEGYYEDIPKEFQSEIRAFLDEYYEKKDTHSASSLKGLNEKELGELLYLEIKKGSPKEIIKHIKKCTKLKILEIKTTVENLDFLTYLEKLVILDLPNKNIKSTKNAFVNLKKLRVISLSGNDTFYNFYEAKEILQGILIFFAEGFSGSDENPINIFPKELINAIHITISEQNLSNLEGINQILNLVDLHLSSNKIKTIPDNIGEVINLRELNLFNNKITSIPATIGHLKNLERLDIGGNLIEIFPIEIFSLKKIKSIYFIENPYKQPSFLEEMNEILKKRITTEDEIDFFHYLKRFPTNIESNYNYFTLKLPKVLQTPMLQYIEFFKDYVEATKGKDIIFEVKRDEEGLVLVTNGNANVTLPELSDYFQEYVSLAQQQSSDWIFNFEKPTSALQADILRLKMENEIGRFKSALDIAKFESEKLSEQLADERAKSEFLQGVVNELTTSIKLSLEGRNAENLNTNQLVLDIIDQAIKMLERKHNHQLEDLHNDILTDFLRQKGYYATDQTRSGRAKLRAGEIDIMIRKKNGTPFSIIETFRLKSCGKENKIVAQHIDKLLHDYDTAGHELNFIIIYAEAKNFEKLWKNYQNYLNEINGNPEFRAEFPLITFEEKTKISRKSSIKTGLAKHRREGSIVEVYHVFINMFS